MELTRCVLGRTGRSRWRLDRCRSKIVVCLALLVVLSVGAVRAAAEPLVALHISGDNSRLEPRVRAELTSLGMSARDLPAHAAEPTREELNSEALAMGAVAVLSSVTESESSTPVALPAGRRVFEVWIVKSGATAAVVPLVVRSEPDATPEDSALRAVEALRARLLKLGLVSERPTVVPHPVAPREPAVQPRERVPSSAPPSATASLRPFPPHGLEMHAGVEAVHLAGALSVAWQMGVALGWMSRGGWGAHLRLGLPVSAAKQRVPEGQVNIKPFEVCAALQRRWLSANGLWGLRLGAELSILGAQMEGVAGAQWSGVHTSAWTAVPGLGLQGAWRFLGPVTAVAEGRVGYALAEPVARVAGREVAHMGRPLAHAGFALRWEGL